jgi:hypothetical protein
MIGNKRAIEEVSARLGLSAREAAAFVRAKIAALTPDAFVRSEIQHYAEGDFQADIYGVKDKHGGWFIKFYEDSGVLVVPSCHEPREELRCVNGKRIPGKQT